jgi:hypothetical protein
MKDKLLNSIRLAISSQDATDVDVDDADSLLAEITGNTNVMDDAGNHDVLDDDVLRDDGQIVEVVASTNGIPADLPTADPQNLTSASEPDLHSIPHIESPSIILSGTHVPVTTPLKSTAWESTSINPNKHSSE